MKRSSIRRRSLFLFAILAIPNITITAMAVDDPWADGVVSYNAIDPNQGFNTPAKTLGEPVGGGTYAPNNSSLHSIGRPGAAPGSYILLEFNTAVTDDPENPMGLDFIVFGNNFWVGGDPQRKWIEAGLVEISDDANGNGLPDDPWYYMPGSRGLTPAILPAGIANLDPPLAGNVLNPGLGNVEYNWGYCELTPTMQKYLDNYVRPDDPFTIGMTARSGGGDAFDIQWAVSEDAGGTLPKLTQFRFIRISAYIAALIPPFGYITPEIDAVADIAPDIDRDDDGILDEYEVRVADTDPERKESCLLALEIPPEFGGSPAGAELGIATDDSGNGIRLFSSGTRSGSRRFNVAVDIHSVGDPAPSLAISGLLKSGAFRKYDSSEPDFSAAKIQDARITIAYKSEEIAGLDEAALQPYRFDGTAFSQTGISSVIKDTAANTVDFSSRYPGIFVLGSMAGSGDSDTKNPEILFSAAPSAGIVGAPGTEILITSEPIYRSDGTLVPDDSLFTVTGSLGAISTSDADPLTDGVQLISTHGVIHFSWMCGKIAGTALLTVISPDGSLHGVVSIPIHIGPPAGPVDIWQLGNTASVPGPVMFYTSVIADAYGNPQPEGAIVTLETEGGILMADDAAPETEGSQLRLTDGSVLFTVHVTGGESGETADLTVSIYADSEKRTRIGRETFHLKNILAPLTAAPWCAVLLGLCSALCLYRSSEKKKRRP